MLNFMPLIHVTCGVNGRHGHLQVPILADINWGQSFVNQYSTNLLLVSLVYLAKVLEAPESPYTDMRCSARNIRDANNDKRSRMEVPRSSSTVRLKEREVSAKITPGRASNICYRTSMALIPQRRNLLNVQNALTNFGNHVHALTRTAGYLDIEHNVNGVWNSCVF